MVSRLKLILRLELSAFCINLDDNFNDIWGLYDCYLEKKLELNLDSSSWFNFVGVIEWMLHYYLSHY